MDITLTKMSETLGLRVEGVDLHQPLDAETQAAVHQAFLDGQVLCFPGQKLSADDQIRFCSYFGKADSDYKAPASKLDLDKRDEADYRKGVMLVSNVRKNGTPIGNLPDGDMQFHSDGAHRPSPYMATTLYGIRVPTHGGDTLFANLYAAYDALDPALKARIDGLNIHNVYMLDATSADEFDAEDPKWRNAVHPLVRVHDETGRKALYANRLMSRWIEGMERSESDALLAELLDVAERPEFIYAHQWAAGDFLIWDNRCINHGRTDFPADQIRLLRRYTVSSAVA
ncbi:MAG: taurine dioxygenase [Alphaproteobacteria bacterium]|jgi:taurine dioxygenase